MSASESGIRDSSAPELDRLRAVLAESRADVTRLRAEVAVGSAGLLTLARLHGHNDPRYAEAQATHRGKIGELDAALERERAAGVNLSGALAEWLGDDAAEDFRRLSAQFPLVLLPVRLETRFDREPGRRPRLLLRIYPDEIFADTHEEELTEAERDAGFDYWAESWNPDSERDAWRILVTRYPPARAAWIVRQTTPDNAGERALIVSPRFPAVEAPPPSEPSPPTALSAVERDAGFEYWSRAWNPDAETAARRALLLAVTEQRAAIVVDATTPTNIAARPARGPAFPRVSLRAGSWTRPAEARLLPDRWVAVAYRGGREVHRAVSRPIIEPMMLTLNPSHAPDDPATTVAISGDGPRLDSQAAWAFDFAKAIEAGMALEIPLDADDLSGGFDRIIVFGVKTSLSAQQGGARLGELIDGHHYGRGLAFLPQGSPTNNTSAGRSAYPPDDSGGAHSFLVERGVTLRTERSDGTLFMRAFGVRPQSADHLDGTGGTEQLRARAMNDALWPVTLGYFLEQMMTPVFDRGAVQEARRYFVENVRGRGPLPAFRVGGTPYAVLPVSSLARWQPRPDSPAIERHLPPLLRTLRETWARQIARVPRVGRTNDADKDLLEVLGMDASAREVRVRHALGGDFYAHLLAFFDAPGEDWMSEQQRLAREVFARVGHPEWEPRIAWMNFAEQAPLFRHPFVTTSAPSEREGLAPDYVNLIRTASIEELRGGRFRSGEAPPTVLLYLMLLHAMLSEFAGTAFDLQVEYQMASEAERAEPELVGFSGLTGQHNAKVSSEVNISQRPSAESGTAVAQSAARPTVWERLDTTIPELTGTSTLGQFLSNQLDATPAARLRSYRTSLESLEGLPTAELERLFTETLDTCSHRLDAWVTSLTTKRLNEMRGVNPSGSYIGAFGWLEDLRPAPPGRVRRRTLSGGRAVNVQTGGGGYVHTPTMDHAAAAAILRNAYLTRAGEERARYAIDLSSERVRAAQWVLDNVRQGQPLAAVLGYSFERGLHERHRPLALDKYIEPFRRMYPLATNTPDSPGAPTEALAARNVVHGVNLHRAWSEGAIPFGGDGFSPNADERAAIEAELRRLDAAVDAVSDLLTAESVYQLVRGNTTAAAASLDTLARGVRPPDIEFASVPRGGVALTHRVGVVLGGGPLPAGAWDGVRRTPRSQAEPYLDAWVGSLFGDPHDVRCRVSYHDSAGGGSGRRSQLEVTLAQLQLRPLDILALAHTPDVTAHAAELDLRVAHTVLGFIPTATDLRIDYARDAGPDGSRVRTFPETLELARAVNNVIKGARQLKPEDLLLPESASTARAAAQLMRDAETRVEGARSAFSAATENLENALAAVRRAPADAIPDLGPLRAALREAALFGVTASFPLSQVGSTKALRAELVGQATSVLSEMRRRGQQAERPEVRGAPEEMARAIFGREFMFLVPFRPAETVELAQALGHAASLVGDENAPRKWFQQAARVRPALERWRKLCLYSRALGVPVDRFEVAQLPHDPGARWVALPLGGGPPPPHGRVSIVLHRPAAPSADATWVGLLLDEWSETIPSKTVDTGIAFHYDDPGSEAAQAVLLAVPPSDEPTWSLDALRDTLNETLELAKLRAVDGELLGALGQLLPAVYLAANTEDDTVATDLSSLLIANPSSITRRA